MRADAGLGGEEEQQTQRGKEAEQTTVYDGMEGLSTKAAKLRFGKDLRLLEVKEIGIHGGIDFQGLPFW